MKNSFKIFKVTLSLLVFAVALAALGLPEVFGAAGLVVAFPLLLGSIKTSDDAKVERSKILEELEGMINLRKTEKRTFTEDEQKTYDEKRADVDKLTEYINQLLDEEKRLFQKAETEIRKNPGVKSAEQKETSEISKYNFAKVFRSLLNGKSGDSLDGLEKEMHDEAVLQHRNAGIPEGITGVGIPDKVFRAKEKRQMNVTGANPIPGDMGGMLVSDEDGGLIRALLPNLVIAGLGARFMPGLRGNVDLRSIGAVVSGWNTEEGAAFDGSPQTAIQQMIPRRLATLALFSKQLQHQSDYFIEGVLTEEIFRSIAVSVESAAVVGGQLNAPLGILSTPTVPNIPIAADGGPLTYALTVAMETAIAQLNAAQGSLGYLTNARVRGAAKVTPKNAGLATGFIWDAGNTMNGYNSAVSSVVPANLAKGLGINLSALIFGNFNDLFVGNWGGMDLTIDPYTAAGTGQVRLIANTFWDVALRRVQSFATITDIVA
jgi:HK97 family phage major capsid protein